MYEEPKKYAAQQANVLGSGMASAVGSYREPLTELVISVELKAMEKTLDELDQAARDFVSRVSPILFYGPENECQATESVCPPGSDIARQIYQLRERLMHVAIFLNNVGQKVNL